MHERFVSLQFLSPSHFDVVEKEGEKLDKNSSFEAAVAELRGLTLRVTPADKMRAALSASFHLQSVIEATGETVSADSLFPRLCFALLRAAPEQLPSQLSFIGAFRRRRIGGEGGILDYCFAHLSAAASFLMRATAEELNIGEDDFVSSLSSSRLSAVMKAWGEGDDESDDARSSSDEDASETVEHGSLAQQHINENTRRRSSAVILSS
mmetsp:Transcript_14622/g.37349  ORF Transcript_14622/g.37349 Transcript_14622/m.37349 type:complete len:209 (+) Transcript_14622:73-699(+)